ncbi:VTT domain-containing protein [Streptomyces sp. ACA25]|uniref:TVP38/TMEM64 family protein n=1 Tax=Streptomyces sp. ACA25 TaxID=3022596 RepID=UPI002307C745|nr:VTT domain-containing protein [Streptomyces sp. ACA25]MDB1089403.1 VTT domain-containing protein [Streptomyces sp. ACA25]
MSAPSAALDRQAAGAARARSRPWLRLALLLMLLAAAGAAVLAYQPHQLLTGGSPALPEGHGALLLYAGIYGVSAAAFVPRPVMNLAAGALFGSAAGVVGALAGTVLGAALAFGIGRLLGRDALRPLLRGRLLTAGDRQLSEHGFRSMLVLRLLPVLPFAATNYAAAMSRMSWKVFLGGTALGSVPSTMAYVVAGSRATTPTSPVFLVTALVIVAGGVAAVVLARRRAGTAAPATGPGSTPALSGA